MTSLKEDDIDGSPHGMDIRRFGSFSFASEDEYFLTHKAPEGLGGVKKRADTFIRFQCAKERRVVLVTSGGSTVPLEVPFLVLCEFSCGRIKRCDTSIISAPEQEELALVSVELH